MSEIKAKAAPIKLLILDVDGVLTNGAIYLTDAGTEIKGFYSRDGIGIKMLLKNGIEVAIISGREAKAVNHRLEALGVKIIYQNIDDKNLIYNKIKNDLKLKDDEIAYLGDDIPDLPPIRHAGLGIAVADADPLVKQHADYITILPGGRGAVREVSELLLTSQDKLQQLQQTYLTYE